GIQQIVFRKKAELAPSLINNGTVYTTGRTVTLDLLSLSGLVSPAQISIAVNSTAEGDFSAWEPYVPSRNLTLPDQQGKNFVIIRVLQVDGTVKPFGDSIFLDSVGPSASFTVNQGLDTVESRDITLNLTASDAVSGVADMRFAIDSTSESSFSPWESFNTTKNLRLPNVPGARSIYVQVRDSLGNVTLVSQSIVYDPTAENFRLALVDDSLSYFSDTTVPAIEPTSGYPHEGYNQRNYTQPTNLGYYAQLLANIITGDIITTHLSKEDAKARLTLMMTTLLTHQSTLGYKGLLPWLSFNGTAWQRDGGAFGQQVMLGDNVNLSASLGAAEGALMDPLLSGDTTVQDIIAKIETFLNNQKQGYDYLYDASAGSFRRGWNFAGNFWVGGSTAYHDFFGEEFRSGILFAMLRYNYPDSVYGKLNIRIKEYTMSTGESVYTVAPWDGGSFQMLWPTLTMPEIDNPDMNRMLQNFVTVALDFSTRNNLHGFLSASYAGMGQYGGNVGIAEISVNTDPRNQSVASLYTLGAAYMVNPQAIDLFLRDIVSVHPNLLSPHGFWEGLNASDQVIQEQIMTNVATFVLGLAGKGPQHMTRYLQNKGLYTRLQSAYPDGTPEDLIATSTNSFSWGGGSGFRSGDEYNISSADFLNPIYSAFIQSSTSDLNGANISGRQLRIRYKSTTEIQNAVLEFKDSESGNQIRLQIDGLNFQNTNGQEEEILIDLPSSMGLLDIDEIILILYGGSGGALNFTLTDLDIL
ncbi:MAG TPA: hypothetical protein VD913_00795, partial [bacterium]|nr:hypothetical protein [bacterium]